MPNNENPSRASESATSEVRPSGAEGMFLDDDEYVGGQAADNSEVLRRQKMLITAGAAVLALCGGWWILSGPSDGEGEASKTTISTDDMINPADAEAAWVSNAEIQQQQMAGKLQSVDAQAVQLAAMQEQIATLQNEKSAMANDGQQVFDAYAEENEKLRAALEVPRPAPLATSPALYGPPVQAKGTETDAAGLAGTPPAFRSRDIKLVSFSGADTGTATRVEKGNTVYSDSANYLPPNSIAKAKVIVGVDATAGVKNQADPLPVVMRITGPARSVYSEGKLLQTRIEGCLVNGAAQGDLSSEKVYVKLLRMTCPQPGGRYAVSEVKGFISFAGKTGVRGRVVSREGSLATQAFLAGMLGGFGRGFSANSSSLLRGSNISVGGQRDQLSTGEILKGGLGEGVAQSGDMVSQYLIDRAEQYQPVIEMPTGIDVEIVFLDGVFIRN